MNHQPCYGETTTPKGRTRRTIPMTSTLEQALRRLDAGLPEKRWHTLRHTFGTHAALFGVNPWRLQSWLGHKRIDETMIYVHVAENHCREIPEAISATATAEVHPDRRVLKVLGARGSHVAAKSVVINERSVAASS